MITYDEAFNIAKEEEPKVNCCAEYTNYYEFWYSYLGLKNPETEEEYLTQLKNSPIEVGKGTMKISKVDGTLKYGSLPLDVMFPDERLMREFEIKQ